VVLSQLIHDMRCRGCQHNTLTGLDRKWRAGEPSLSLMASHWSKPALPRGINQGCPLSRILFQFYNLDLVNVQDPNNAEEVVAFMDNTLILVSGKSLTIMNTKVKDMMVRRDGRLDWSATHHCKFVMSKFGIVFYHPSSGICHSLGQDPSHLDDDVTQYMWHGLLPMASSFSSAQLQSIHPFCFHLDLLLSKLTTHRKSILSGDPCEAWPSSMDLATSA